MTNHSGHRERMKKRFLDEGLDNFSEIQVLEILLFYCIPQKDTNPIAHELMNRFGSLSQVLDAPVSELKKVDGIGEHAAIFLRLITEAGRYYQVNRSSQNTVLPTLKECAQYLLPFFFGRRVETVFLLCLDARCKVLCCREISEGGVYSVKLPTRKIVEAALGAGAVSAVLAHNHPSGETNPSMEDIEFTRKAYLALEAVEVKLAEHFVVAGNRYASILHGTYPAVTEGVPYGQI